ncbi:MAG: hypothetical protein VX603_12705 [Gemmatimonadota bacterium]|nr:hypothetical protein [Gemmatimonadota bacterium]
MNEVDASAMAVAEHPTQIVEILTYITQQI